MASAVLDLDLDFFAERMNCDRFDEDDYKPPLWSEEDFVSFLEGQCGLSTASPLPGRVFIEHHEALGFWQDLMEQGLLSAPFSVIHVDAHADLGFDQSDRYYRWVPHLTEQVLVRDVDCRYQPGCDLPFVNEGNYLLFAAAWRWLKDMKYVTHPDWHFDGLPGEFVTHREREDWAIELGRWPDPNVFLDPASFNVFFPKPTRTEPRIPLSFVSGAAFTCPPNVCAVSLALSPAYARREPRLPAAFRRYIRDV